MPLLREGDAPPRTGVEASQHFTQPPPRFSEASLVKRLEELGIGRPSTYASILQTLKDREYVRVEKNRFHPRGERPAGDGLPRAVLREICQLRLTPPSWRRSSTTSPAGGSIGSGCSTSSGAISSPRPAR
jgi:hypothetical protein